MPEPSFSFRELSEAKKVPLPEPEFISASDGVTLAYRRYAPPAPRAVLLFYHGGGAYSGAGYQFLGNGLESGYHTLVIMPDIRGHGGSAGPRGDAPSPQQVWADISTFIYYFHSQYPRLPLFLGGHSSGAGLVLNYLIQPGRAAVDGFVFLSPRLGNSSQTERAELKAPFAKVDVSAFIANSASRGPEHGHDYAVQFNYPAEVLAADPGFVGSITVNMSNALTPPAPAEQFARIDRPLGLWIGAEDELFYPEKVVAFAGLARPNQPGSEAGIIPGAKHLSILVRAHETVGPWIEKQLKLLS